MTVETLRPDVYFQEQPVVPSFPNTPINNFGLLIAAEKGPLNEPTLVTSFLDYQKKFGGFYKGYFGPHAARLFFAEGGARAYVVRVAGSGNAKATINALDTASASPTLQIDAMNEGAWGNSISAVFQSFISTVKTLVSPGATNTIALNSVSGLKIGDRIQFFDGALKIYKFVYGINVATGVVTLDSSYTVITSIAVGTSVATASMHRMSTKLVSDIAPGARTQLQVVDATNARVGQVIHIMDGTSWHEVILTGVNGDVLQFASSVTKSGQISNKFLHLLKLAEDGFKSGDVVTGQFATIVEGLNAQLKILYNHIDVLASQFGDVLIPPLTVVVTLLSKMLFIVSQIPKPIKAGLVLIAGLTASLAFLTAALTGTIAAALGATAAIFGIVRQATTSTTGTFFTNLNSALAQFSTQAAMNSGSKFGAAFINAVSSKLTDQWPVVIHKAVAGGNTEVVKEVLSTLTTKDFFTGFIAGFKAEYPRVFAVFDTVFGGLFRKGNSLLGKAQKFGANTAKAFSDGYDKTLAGAKGLQSRLFPDKQALFLDNLKRVSKHIKGVAKFKISPQLSPIDPFANLSVSLEKAKNISKTIKKITPKRVLPKYIPDDTFSILTKEFPRRLKQNVLGIYDDVLVPIGAKADKFLIKTSLRIDDLFSNIISSARNMVKEEISLVKGFVQELGPVAKATAKIQNIEKGIKAPFQALWEQKGQVKENRQQVSRRLYGLPLRR